MLHERIKFGMAIATGTIAEDDPHLAVGAANGGTKRKPRANTQRTKHARIDLGERRAQKHHVRRGRHEIAAIGHQYCVVARFALEHAKKREWVDIGTEGLACSSISASRTASRAHNCAIHVDHREAVSVAEDCAASVSRNRPASPIAAMSGRRFMCASFVLRFAAMSCAAHFDRSRAENRTVPRPGPHNWLLAAPAAACVGSAADSRGPTVRAPYATDTPVHLAARRGVLRVRL